MPRKKERKRHIRVKAVSDARAGLIPGSDDIADEHKTRLDRVVWLIRTMRPYTGQTKRVTEDLVITDILADLRYYCACMDLPFDRLDAAATSANIR